MATQPILLRVTLPDVDGLAVDEAVNQFVFNSPTPALCVTKVEAFYNGANTSLPLSGYISSSRSRVANAVMIQSYELAGFLHGEPHGSPIQTDFFTLGASSGNDLPDQLAAVLSTHGDVTALPEHGPTVARPSSELAIDEGAPATHLAKTRPRASLRGRLYLGPLDSQAMSNTGELSATLLTDLAQAAHTLIVTSPTDPLVVWSRTYGTVVPVIGGWIAHDFGTVRRRRDKTSIRTAWV